MSKKVSKAKYFGMMSGEPAALYSVVSENKKVEDKKLDEEVAKLKPVDTTVASSDGLIKGSSEKSVDAATKEAAKAEEEKLKKRKGYKSTILTGPLGLTEPAPTKKTTLG